MRLKKRKGCATGCIAGLMILGLFVGGGYFWSNSRLAPMPSGAPFYLRLNSPRPLFDVLKELNTKKVVRDPAMLSLYAWLKRSPQTVGRGTYQLHAGMTAGLLLSQLRNPVIILRRLPEGYWMDRSAQLLESFLVCTADEYIELASDPSRFAKDVSFTLPKSGSLEGYLYPDTYDLPPTLGAAETIRMQLQNFERKVLRVLPPDADLQRLAIIASLIELEVKKPNERRRVSGVIHNRLKRGMRLQIDATVLYALQEWKQLGPGEVGSVDSPYNTYRIAGLPPGPICSPTAPSFEAANNPERHDELYYVALPDGSHLFAKTYEGHLANIRKRKAALSAATK